MLSKTDSHSASQQPMCWKWPAVDQNTWCGITFSQLKAEEFGQLDDGREPCRWTGWERPTSSSRTLELRFGNKGTLSHVKNSKKWEQKTRRAIKEKGDIAVQWNVGNAAWAASREEMTQKRGVYYNLVKNQLELGSWVLGIFPHRVSQKCTNPNNFAQHGILILPPRLQKHLH